VATTKPGRSVEARLVVVAAAALFLLLTAASFRRIWEADFWWQLETGKIVATQGIPRIDTLSHAARGSPWIEMRWLYCLALHVVVGAAGFPGAVVAKWLVLLAAFGLAAWTVPPRGAPVAACVAASLAILASTQRFYVRPELASFLFFAAIVWILERHLRSGSRLLYAIPALQIAWANCHTLFLLGPAVVGLAFVVEAVRALPRAPRRLLPLAAVLGATTLACLATPYGARGVAFGLRLVGELHDPVFRQVSAELRGTFSFGQRYTAVVYYEALLALCAVAALPVLRRLDPFRTALLISQGYLSVVSIRNLPLFCLAAIPFVVDAFSRWPEPGRSATARLVPAVRLAVLAAVVALCAVTLRDLVTDRFHVDQNDTNQFGAGLARHRFAEGAERYLREHSSSGPVFNTMLEGAYLLAHGIPVFIDPRLEVHGRERLARYLRMQEDEGAWKEDLARYGFRLAVVDLQSPFAARLTEAEGWDLAYFDETAAVFARSAPGEARPALRSEADFRSASARIRERLPAPRRYDDAGLLGRVESPAPYLRVADFLLRMGQANLAEPFARDALAAFPRTAAAHGILGQILERRGDARGAASEYVAELAVAPENALARRQAGMFLLATGQAERARVLLEASVAALPDDARAWAALARIHAESRRSSDAVRCAEQAARLEPRNAGYQTNLGRVLGMSGRLDAAVEALRRGLALDPGDAGSWGDLAAFLAKAGRREEARSAIARAVALAPNDGEIRGIAAAIEGESGRP
jgi:Flp pilus assembly protein TadD